MHITYKIEFDQSKSYLKESLYTIYSYSLLQFIFIFSRFWNKGSKIFGWDLRRQKKLEVQIASFSLTPGDLDDLLEDLIPKPINSEQEFDRLGMELQETVYRRKMVRPIAWKIVYRFIIMLLKSWLIICTIQGNDL